MVRLTMDTATAAGSTNEVHHHSLLRDSTTMLRPEEAQLLRGYDTLEIELIMLREFEE